MTEKQTTFVKQAAILAAAGLIVRFIGFLYRLPLTAMIGDEGNGIYGAGYYLYTFFLIVSSAGLPAAISKMVSHRLALGQHTDAHRVFRVSLVVAGVAGLLGALALGLGAEWLANAVESPRSYYAIMSLVPTVFIVAIMAVFRGYFQGMNNTVPTAVSQIIEQVFNAVFSVLLCYVFMKQTEDIALGAAGGTAGTGVGALAGLLAIMVIYFLFLPPAPGRVGGKYAPPTESDVTLAKELIKTALPIIIGTAIFSMTNLIDMVMVNRRLLSVGHSREQVDAMYGLLTGKYVTLTTLPVSISTAIATAAVPNIARSIATNDKANANRKINTALKLTMIVSIPASVGIGVLGGPILKLLFPSYSDGGYLLQLGAVSIIFLALAQIVTGMLQGSGYVHIPAIAAFCGALVKIPLNYVLIPIQSVTFLGVTVEINVGGAVISTVGCYMVASAIDLTVLRRVMGRDARLDMKGGFVKPLIASLVMGLSCYIFYYVLYSLWPSNSIACLSSIALGICVYFAYLLLIKGISREDLMSVPYGSRIAGVLERFTLL